MLAFTQRDEPVYRELQKYLVLWQKQGRIYWANPASIQQADLVLLLLSPDFFVARGCQMGMARAFEMRTERGIPVVPVLARASNWKESACGALQALPDNDRPIVEWRPKERAYENICAGLARLLPDLPALGIAPPEGLRLFQARDLPKGYVARPTEFVAAKQLLLHRQGAQAAAITTALRGAGGFGKTTLALALCHDPELQAAFLDGILWVELGEHPPRPRDVLNGLLASLEPRRAEAVTLEEAKKRWRSALQDRVCLLVIDDVWQAETLFPLLEGGPHCQRLVTTRNDLLLPRDATRILVDAMVPQEAVAVLSQGLPEAIHQATHLDALATRLGCWPLLLTLANGLLTDLMDAQMSLTQALATVAQAYETRGVTAFRLDNVEERQRTVDACLSVSIEHLRAFTPAHYHATERYQELAVFSEDTDIPLATLEVYWKGIGGLESWEAKDLCIRLHRLSLLLACDLGKGTVRLHDVIRSYLVQRVGTHLSDLHLHFLDAFRQALQLTHWADLPLGEHYLWQHLIWHLGQAEAWQEIQAILTDLAYLARKAFVVGVATLEADFVQVNAFQQTDAHEMPLSFLESLHRMLMRQNHLLRRAQTLGEVGGLLLSYMGWYPFFAAQRLALERTLPLPFLTARHPLPERAPSALRRTLSGHTNAVSACAISADGSVIVSASKDQMLKVWDGATGAERFTLKGHTGEVNACAISADGGVIVSASWDYTLKVWDGATGAERFTLTGHTSLVRGCAISADGSVIVCASWDYTLKVWDGATGAERFTLRDGLLLVEGCAISADGRLIVSAYFEGMLKVWDGASGKVCLTLTGHTEDVSACAISADGGMIVSASWDQTLKVWDATTGAERLTFTGHSGYVFGCAISADGSVIVSAANDDMLKVWDATTRAERLTLPGYTGEVTACAISADGGMIVSASDEGTLKVWNGVSGAERFTLKGHSGAVFGCAISANGCIIVSVSSDQTLKVWESQAGRYLLTFPSDGRLDSCAISANGEHLVACGYQGVYFLQLVV